MRDFFDKGRRQSLRQRSESALDAFLILAGIATTLAAETNSLDDEIPPLHPPHGLIAPTFWEQHGVGIILGVCLLLAIGSAIVWRLTRPKPPIILRPGVVAKQELEALRREPENGQLLSKVSQVLRRYVAATFDLPPGEMTTSDFCRSISSDTKVGQELTTALGDFLRLCDRRKFALSEPEPALGAVEGSLSLINRCEARKSELRAQLRPPSTMPQTAVGNTPGAPKA